MKISPRQICYLLFEEVNDETLKATAEFIQKCQKEGKDVLECTKEQDLQLS